jgi:G:T/U-mismatch repair DNA glycosylase
MNRGGGFFNDYSLMKKKKDDAFDIKAVLKHHKQAN